jgi:O-antigen ligase
VVLGTLSVLYTFSRGGLICVALGSGATLMYIFRSKPWIPVLTGVLATLVLIQYGDTFERQLSFLSNPQDQITQPSILHRYVSYRGYMQQIEESPMTGVGWGAREYYWGRSRLYSFWEVRYGLSTGKIVRFGGLNSLLFNQAVKGGIPALLAMLIVFASVYAAGVKGIRKSREDIMAAGLTGGIFGFMIHQVVDSQILFPTVNSLFWLSVGAILAIVSMKRREEPVPVTSRRVS